MKLYKVRAFSLTELLIVLVVVALLFTALVPIMTKRHNGATAGEEPVWSFVSNDDDKDAYYDGGIIKQTSTAYVGVKPRDISDKKPYSKVVLKANKANDKPQNMIQFRYGSGNGTLTGIFFADDKGNYFHTSRLKGSPSDNYNKIIVNSTDSIENTLLGPDVVAEAEKGTRNVVIGSSALSKTRVPLSNVVVGAGAGENANKRNVIVGAGAGVGSSAYDNNILLGANIMSFDRSQGQGYNNVVAGSNVAVAGLLNNTSFKSTGNTIIGADQFKATYLKNSTVIGHSAFVGGNDDEIEPENLTAIGYNTCSSMKSTGKYGKGARTCIGSTSGQATNNTPVSFAEDDYDHVFLGGAPSGAWAGRSVLEVHNKSVSAYDMGVGAGSFPVVVLNSHLVVRGNLVIPSMVNSITDLFPVIYAPSSRQNKIINDYDYCTKRCVSNSFRRNYNDWREYKQCGKLFDTVLTFVNAVAFPLKVVLTPIAVFTWGIFDSDAGKKWCDFIANSFEDVHVEKDRVLKEPRSYSVMTLVPGLSCKNNPEVCPQLKVSDIRLKENIVENNDALAKIMNVTPYSYTYKADKNSLPQVGVIAQDLQTYMPNSVSKDKDGFLRIRWDEMFFTALNSIKAIDSKLNNLAIIVRAMEEDSVQIAKEQKSVKKRINDIDKRLNKLEK